MTYPTLCALLASKPTKLSYKMHTAGFNALKLPFTYFTIDTEDTKGAIKAMRYLGIRGYSLTIPHKETALAFLDNIDDDAKKIGAVNTVINNQGVLTGYNTDWIGITESFREANIDLQNKRALIIGAGGAARAAVYALLSSNVKSISVASRNLERALSLAHDFKVAAMSYEDLKTTPLSSFDILLNATPIGSHLVEKGGELPLAMEQITANHVVFDMVTNETELLRIAAKQGAKTIAGIRMLLHQAVKQFELFTGKNAPIAEMETALISN